MELWQFFTKLSMNQTWSWGQVSEILRMQSGAFFWLSFPGAAENWIPKRRAGKCHQMAPPAPLNLNCFSSSPQRSCLILGFLWPSQPCAPITGARAQSPRKVFAATKESYFQATSLAAVCSSEFINEVSWWSWCIVLSPFHQSCGILWSVGFYHG